MKQVRIGEFAEQVGVTLRTLRYYDRIGLLKPSARSEAGQRLYSESDYARLQQILTLKLIGLPLEEIKTLLTTEPAAMDWLLERQKHVLREQVSRLTRVIETIEAAQNALHSPHELDWEGFIQIIKAVNMNTQSDWLAQFVTPEEIEKLAMMYQGWTLAEQKQASLLWKQLFHDVRAVMDKDPASPEAQALVDRLDVLLAQYSEGNPDFTARLTDAYASITTLPDMDKAPEEVQAWVRERREAASFMQRAREARKQS